MAIIIRTVQNVSTSHINITLPVPGYDSTKLPVVLAFGATVDLFTVMSGDQLEAIQTTLNGYVYAGSLAVIATVDTATFSPVGGGGVSTLNTLSGAVTLAAGTNVTLSQLGQAITINATGGGSGLTQLTGDVTAGPGTGSQVATVASVDGSSAANVHSAELAANAATSTNTPSTIVKRDAGGNISVSTVTLDNPSSASQILLAGDSFLGSSDTNGIKEYLIYNASGNRQFGFTDSAYPVDTVSPVIRFIFDSTGEPKIEAISTDFSTGIRLSVGNSAGVDLNGIIGISAAPTDFTNIGEGTNPPSNPPGPYFTPKLVIFGQLPTSTTTAIVANPLSNGGQTGDLLDFWDENVALVASVSSEGNLIVPSVATAAIQLTTSPTAGFVLTSDASGNGTWQAPRSTAVAVLSSATHGGAAAEEVTVAGLLTTSTILAVSQQVAGGAALPLTGWTKVINGSLNITYSADMGPGARVLVYFIP